jgi:iron complex outermembrane recepter protein
MLNNEQSKSDAKAKLGGHVFPSNGLTIAAALFCCTMLTGPAFAQSAPADQSEGQDQEIVVTGSLDALPLKDVGSVFGFDKTILETPRSASSISDEQMSRFGITEIYDLVAQAPGTFTNSFFGVGGALDIRGTPGEVYFRGVRRLDNPGNYPTPIGASDRIDIVRGPASPIYGPSKTGGYMNFVPKSARVQGGSYMKKPEGSVSFTGGSWEKAVLQAEIRGPGKIFGKDFGYSIYAEVEDSGSYYDNMFTKQTILQASFETDLAPNLRLEFGAMYHRFVGQQNGGWNRLTQDLVDNGTYITGQARPVDANGDGELSQQEFDLIGNFGPFGNFACPAGTTSGPTPFATGLTNACLNASFPFLSLTNVGTTTLSRRKVLTGEDDTLENRATTIYMDLIFDAGNDFEIKNQLFFDGYDNLNENSYGFSQFHDSYVIENKLVLSKKFESDIGKFAIQASPSVRYTNFEHGDDFFYEYFHRVDLTKGYNALSNRLLSTECNCDYSEYYAGSYTNWAMAGLVDLDFNFGLNLVLGARYDDVSAKSRNENLRFGPGVSVKNSDNGWSYTASASYRLPFGLIPYITYSRQSTLIAGQGADLTTDNVSAKTFISASKLKEAGIKGSFLDNKLYAAFSIYEQERTDFNAQSIVTNQAVQTKGMEAEFRWSVNDNLFITGAYTNTNVYNLTALESGTLFSFFGIEDLVNVTNPALYLGGQPIGLVPIPNKEASRRAGIPKNLFSLTGTYKFDNGLAFNASVVQVASVFSGQSQVVKLPSYTLVDLGASYETDKWLFRVVVKNATNEKYFRANFTELFGSTIVLPERPRSVQLTAKYKF